MSSSQAVVIIALLNLKRGLVKELKLIGIVGAGQMGRGIAQVAAQNGFEVKIFDVSKDGLQFALNFIHQQLKSGAEKGKWSEAQEMEARKKINPAYQLSELKNCQLVIEAASENKKIKFEIFKDLDNVVDAGCLLVSNTSSISITEIGAQTKRPHLVAGMHFMNPVPVMKLVEGIRGLETSEETFSTIEAVALKMGKVFIKANDLPGFAVNRILMPMINEAIYALYEGVASARDIDQAMKLGTNQPMGPFELADFIGLDTCLAIMEVLHEGLGDSKYRPCPLLKKYVLAGRMGKKCKRGFYDYASIN